jgi:hypothetical protein
MFDPKFDETAAIFIIWARSRHGGMRTLAAGRFGAMAAAWEAVQTECPEDELTLQQRARVLRSRPPLIGVASG